MKRVRRYARTGEQFPHFDFRRDSSLKIAVVIASACIVLSMAACQQAELKPLEITQNDVCFRCKSPIADKHYAAELITKDGFVRKFDDIGCMLQHAKTRIGKNNILGYFVMDFPSQQWVKADEASFVKSEGFKTPKDGGILAFKDHAKAQALAQQYKAQMVTLEDLLK